MANKQLMHYNFTSFFKGDYDEIIEYLRNDEDIENWIFQQEQCPSTNNIHYQGKIKLFYDKKKRLGGMKKYLTGPLKGANISISHDTEAATFYCMKDDTRLNGPWADEKLNSDLRVIIPWDLAVITQWYQWQLDFFETLKVKDDRIINVLFDSKGGKGKSKVMKFAAWKRWAGVIPCIGDAKDLIQACCSMGARDAYVLDLPRAGESENHLRSQIKAIEQIKNGFVYDLRNSYKEMIFGSPVIWVFTNQDIPIHLLSSDRWRIWIIEKNQLILRCCSSQC